ncbi:MAG: hypothetical protein ACR2MT_15380 [Aurantibacter sp.]
MKREDFIKSCALSVPMMVLPMAPFAKVQEEPIITLDEITEFVFAAHNDFDKTKAMVQKNPVILNAANQFTKGDFETALGGASHMGRDDIAKMLVARGARMDIFNLTFLGFTDVVKNLIEANPQYLMAPGPHGFNLLHHANVGKHTEFAEWLRDQGLEETRFKDVF